MSSAKRKIKRPSGRPPKKRSSTAPSARVRKLAAILGIGVPALTLLLGGSLYARSVYKENRIKNQPRQSRENIASRSPEEIKQKEIKQYLESYRGLPKYDQAEKAFLKLTPAFQDAIRKYKYLQPALVDDNEMNQEFSRDPKTWIAKQDEFMKMSTNQLLDYFMIGDANYNKYAKYGLDRLLDSSSFNDAFMRKLEILGKESNQTNFVTALKRGLEIEGLKPKIMDLYMVDNLR